MMDADPDIEETPCPETVTKVGLGMEGLEQIMNVDPHPSNSQGSETEEDEAELVKLVTSRTELWFYDNPERKGIAMNNVRTIVKGIVAAGESKRILETRGSAETKTALNNAIERGTWLKGQDVSPATSQNSTPSVSQVQETEMEATTVAWAEPYVGKSCQLLEAAIADIVSQSHAPHPYQNVLAIIQSSGTGKSRTVHEVAARFFSIPVNLRFRKLGEHAFPEPDDRIREYMTSQKAEQAVKPFCILLKAIFDAVCKGVKEFMAPNGVPFAEAWRDHLGQAGTGSVRNQLYGDAVNNAQGFKGIENAKVVDLKNSALASLKALVKMIRKQKNKTKGHILIYFDESHTLYPPDKSDSATRKSLYDDLAHCLDYLQEHLVAVFLSTNSKLGRLAAAQPYHSSMRVSADSDIALPAPFTELPFDCEWGRQRIVTKRSMDLSDITCPGFLVKFGRPLWYTRYVNNSSATKEQEIVVFAKKKLLGREIPLPGNYLKPAEDIAVLSVCIMLDFEPPRHVTEQTEAIQVERHMRIAYSVPKHRSYMRSGTPSEPILAEAAAQLMEHVQNAPSRLSDFVNEGLVDKGHAGELTARLLLTLAYQRVFRLNDIPDLREEISEDHVPDEGSGGYLPHSRGCKLSRFLTALFGPDNYETLSVSMPDNQPMGESSSFDTLFENAWVRFTHFGRADDQKVITTQFLWAAFLRCMAVQCSVNQPSVDIIIPVLINKKLPVSSENMTALMFSVKNRTCAAHVNRINFTATKLGLFRNREPPRPYLNILMQLGVSDNAEFRVLKPSKTSRATSIHPRFTINSIGCAPEVYPIVPVQRVDVYKGLLLSQNTLAEHPRRGEASLKAVRALKPFWDDESYESWISFEDGAGEVGAEEESEEEESEEEDGIEEG